MARGLGLAILAITASGLLQLIAAQTTHIVGDSLGWLVPPGGSIAYQIWADTQTFSVGDILVFKFSDEYQDVARVTEEAFKSCNSTNPISLKSKSPANFTLDSTGEYYFIGTKEDHCRLGQKLAIDVTDYPGPTPSPAPRGPVSYVVGEKLGWFVPPAGPYFYATWAYDKTFEVGDTLVFDFLNETTDVAIVTKGVYENCTKNNTIKVYSTSPANITLTNPGEHFFTSTYPSHCELGQKLAINVTERSSAAPPSTGAAPSISVAPSSSNGPAAPPQLTNSAPARISNGYFFTFVLTVYILI